MTTKHPLRHAYSNMISRCYNTNDKRYDTYGKRGIKVCDAWMNKRTGFAQFVEDMREKPSNKHSLDRIDKDGNYEPSNCKWSTNRQKSNNRSSNYKLTYQGRTQTLMEWFEESPIKVYGTLLNRYHKHLNDWTVGQILGFDPKPPRSGDIYRTKYTYKGETKSLTEWAKLFNIAFATLSSRIHESGLTIAEALEMPISDGAGRTRLDGKPAKTPKNKKTKANINAIAPAIFSRY